MEKQSATALSVKNLTVTLGNEKVLDNLSFEVATGESLAIIGPNGAGKTMLFRALIGVLSYKGKISWAPKTTIGYVPQKLDIERNLPLSLLDLLTSKNNHRHSITASLKLVRLKENLLNRPIGALSGGQFQKALIAFALLQDPRVLLFDEPTAGVDTPGEEHIYETIHRLQEEKGFTILLISHDLSLVYRYADKVLCLNRENLCFGEPEVIMAPEILGKLYGEERSFYKHHRHDIFPPIK
ncbi:MAG TPA: metal ABC transporter ATP-binding protein [Candidatus Paceibacterota bacterium]